MASIRSRRGWIALLACTIAGSAAAQDGRDAAFALEKQGRSAEAESVWRQLAEGRPGDPEPWAHLGLLAARQQHYTDAIAAYRHALDLNSALPGLAFNLGLAYFKAGDYAHAVETFRPLERTVAAGSEEAQRLAILLGMAHYGLGQYDAAVPHLWQAAAADAHNQTLLLTLAHACLFSRQYQCVLENYHKLVALNAESAETDMLAGEALDEMKDPVGAIREFRLAVAANPKEPNAHFGLGYLLWTKGQYPEAADEFKAEIGNNPRHQQSMLYLADAYLQMSRMDEAQALLEMLEANAPESAMQHLDLGQVYVERARNEDALKQFLAAERLEPGNVNAHWRLGRLYRAMGRAAEAKAELEKARSLNKAEDDRLLKVMSAQPASTQPATQQK